MSKELTPEQRAKRAARMKQYYQDHKVEIAARGKRYRQSHKDKVAAQKKQYYQNNKAEIATKKKQFYQDHKRDITTAHKRYYQDHKAEIIERTRRYERSHKIETRHNKLIYSYGIGLEEYDKLFAAQEGRCAICGRHQTELSKVLGIDHDHRTGKIRGLLCQSCNLALGNAFDDIWILERAIKYLQIHLAVSH